MIDKTLSSGTIIYSNTTWNVAEKCEIKCFVPATDDDPDYYVVRSHVHGGTFGALLEKSFLTEKEAIIAYQEETLIKTKEIKATLNTMKDVLDYALQHMSDEYVPEAERRAIKERGYELLEIEINLDLER